MNTSEFRIGNRCNNGTIISIDGSFITCSGHYNISGMTSFDSSDIKPELLTEETLIRFGFKKVEGPDGTHYENEKCWVYLLDGFFEFELITGTERFNLFQTYKYVHELQNLHQILTRKELNY